MPENGARMEGRPVSGAPWPYAYWLLLIPFVATLWPPLYAHAEPSLAGIPFFYWYQFACIVLTAIVVGTVYALTRTKRP